jgi:trigger factor
VDVSFPEDHAIETLRGKTITLATECLAVKEKKVPELDETFAKSLGGEEMTLENLRAEMKTIVMRRKQQARETTLTNQVLAALHDRVEFDIPQEIIDREAQRRTNDIAQRAMQNGMGEEELMKHQDEILGSATQQARQSVKVNFLLEEIAKKENIGVSDQQLTSALSMYADRSKVPFKKFIAQAQKSGMINNLREDLLLQNALGFLKENAAIEETEPEPEHCEEHSK